MTVFLFNYYAWVAGMEKFPLKIKGVKRAGKNSCMKKVSQCVLAQMKNDRKPNNYWYS